MKQVYVVCDGGQYGRHPSPFLVTRDLRKALRAAIANLAENWNQYEYSWRCEFFARADILARIRRGIPRRVRKASKFNETDYYWRNGATQKFLVGREKKILHANNGSWNSSVVYRLPHEVKFKAGRDKMVYQKREKR
jgi:hypothetical protein